MNVFPSNYIFETCLRKYFEYGKTKQQTTSQFKEYEQMFSYTMLTYSFIDGTKELRVVSYFKFNSKQNVYLK